MTYGQYLRKPFHWSGPNCLIDVTRTSHFFHLARGCVVSSAPGVQQRVTLTLMQQFSEYNEYKYSIYRWNFPKRNRDLTAHNWQKWKRVLLTCPCRKIYRDEAVGLKSCKNTWKITIFVKMWNLGQYRENLIFCQ